MPVHASVLAGTRKQHEATALGGAQGQLLEGVDLAPRLEDVARGWLFTQSAYNLQVGHLLDMNLISYSPYNHNKKIIITTVVLSSGREASSSRSFGKGTQVVSWWTHEQPFQHHLVEGGIGLSGQKPVQLCQQAWVDVLALGLLTPNL